MPIENGDYVPADDEAIHDRLTTVLEEINSDAEVVDGSFNDALITTVAETIVEQQERELDDLYDAAYLQTAADEQLSKRVKDLGLQRRPAIPATGIIEFRQSTARTTDVSVPKGTLIETDGDDPITFTSTSLARLPHVDSFEDDLSDYSGDKTNFSIQSSVAQDGSALQADAVSGARIANSNVTLERGQVLQLFTQVDTGGISQTQFFVQDSSNYYQLTIDESNGTVAIEYVSGGSVQSTVASDSVTVPAGELLRVELSCLRDGALQASVDDAAANDVTTVSGTDSNYDSGYVAFQSGDGTANKYWDEVSVVRSRANIEGSEGGAETNVGSQTIRVLPSLPAGIDSAINPIATGDNELVDLNGEPLTRGQDRETDEELRERAFQSTAIGGAATVPAVRTKLRQNREVQSVTLNVNDSDSSSNGLPATSAEPVVYGGADEDVAQALHESISVTEELVGGVNGTKVSVDVNSDILGGTRTIVFSRPPKLDLDITLDVVYDDGYVGADELRRRIINYIGGTLADGTDVYGTQQGEDIYLDRIRDIVVGEDTNVVAVADSVLDTNGDGTDDTTSNANGATVISVADNEVALTNADSITINETKR